MAIHSHRATALAPALLALLLLPTPAAAGWSTPVRISPRSLTDPALAVDGHGRRHVVARGEDGLWYVTDRSGAWTEQRLTRDGPLVEYERVRADSPDIDIDPRDGTIVIAWVRSVPVGTGGCSGEVRYQTLHGGHWSIVRQVPTDGCIGDVDLEVRDGRIMVAATISHYEDQRIEIVSGGPGHWSHAFLGEQDGSGDPYPVAFARTASLELDPDGRPSVGYQRVAFLEGGMIRLSVRWAHHEPGHPGLVSSPVDRVTDAPVDVSDVALVLDRQGRPRVAWILAGEVVVRRLVDGEWRTEPGLAGDGWLVSVGIAKDARTVVAVARQQDGLTVHLTQGDGWSSRLLDGSSAWDLSDLVRGPNGSLHVAWQRGEWGAHPHVWISRLG